MAISFVGSYVGTHAATSAQTINFSNLRNESNAQPTLQEGDLVLVAVENASTVDRTQAQLTPSGYTARHTDDYRNDSNDSNLLVSSKFMGSTPDTTVAIPASNATTAGVAYAIYVFRGVSPSIPMDATPVVTGATNTGVANAAAITPVTAGAWIVVFGGAAVAAGAVFTNPAGMSGTTNHFRSATITTTTNDANIGGAIYTGWTSGAYDPAAFGGSTSTNTGSWSAVTLALRPIVTHDATGGITGPGAEVAGTATLTPSATPHPSSGSLIGQGSAIAGTSLRFRAFDAAGALAGQGATLAGAAAHKVLHTSTGALSGPGAGLAGVAVHNGAHGATGGLAGQIGGVVATATRFRAHGSTGTLAGPGSAVTGTAAKAVAHDATGAFSGQGSVVTGSATKAVIRNATGALTGPGSVIAGNAALVVIHTASGALTGQGAVCEAHARLGDVPAWHDAHFNRRLMRQFIR